MGFDLDEKIGQEIQMMKNLVIVTIMIFLTVGTVLSQATNGTKNDAEVRSRELATEWVKNFKSKRVDAALEKDIRKWWAGPDPTKIPDPIIKIDFLQLGYEITRNEYGEVLRRTVDALILWKERTGTKCYVQWRSFGYESLGGGTFNNEMGAWVKKDQVGFGYYPRFIPLPENREIPAGGWTEVNCSGFK